MVMGGMGSREVPNSSPYKKRVPQQYINNNSLLDLTRLTNR